MVGGQLPKSQVIGDSGERAQAKNSTKEDALRVFGDCDGTLYNTFMGVLIKAKLFCLPTVHL